MRLIAAAVAAAVLCLSSGFSALAAPTPAQLEAGLAGRWQGALGYRDYQTGKLFELPMTTEVTALADGVTVLRVSAFDDGPKAGTVYITTASLFDAAAGTVTSASFRKARPVELTTENVSVTAYVDDRHWSIIFEHTGADGDEPSQIRVTETLDGDHLLTVKEVRPLAAKDGVWAMRNQIRLTRSPTQ